ncbi:MAG: serine protease [Elusimicrobia bacterium]|nr:serine protease [Elusimicrobiota bacterium]
MTTIAEWIDARLAIVIGSDGRGGSGICIETAEGEVAVLTARHVVVDCIRTGALLVGRRSQHSTIRPTRIRISSQSDVAYLIVDKNAFQGDYLSYPEWTKPYASITNSQSVMAYGALGSEKEIDIEARTISSVKILSYLTKISKFKDDLITCDIIPDRDTPKTFKGMSGGPLFDLNGNFMGVLIEEIRRGGESIPTALQIAPVNELKELHVPFQSPLNDYFGEKITARTLDIVNPENTGITDKLEVNGEFYWSDKTPDALYGKMGKILFLRFLTGNAQYYPINTEALFTWDTNTKAERIKSFDEAVRFFLFSIGWGIDPKQKTI